MKVLVTGAGGQLGRAVVLAVTARGDVADGIAHGDVAVEDRDAVMSAVADRAPQVVVHCGAWTDVDGCELDPERADLVNGQGTANVADACREHGAHLVYVSTDFVFDGAGTAPYGPDDPTGPISAYGRSKLSGERAVLERSPAFHVVRTSWVFGPGGRNFPAAILGRARAGGPLRVVDDQVGSPTFTPDLAEALLDLAVSGAPGGVYHASNEGVCSWHAFAVALVEAAGLGDVEVARMSSSELDRPAPRPAYSVLDASKLTAVRGRPLPDLASAIDRYLAAEAGD